MGRRRIRGGRDAWTGERLFVAGRPKWQVAALALALAAAMPAGTFASEGHLLSRCVGQQHKLMLLRETLLAEFQRMPLAEVRLTYLDRASYRLETDSGLSVTTEFDGDAAPGARLRDAVTVGEVDPSHWSAVPERAVHRVLRAQDAIGRVTRHHVDLGPMLIRNVPTEFPSPSDEGGPDGNSIFVFEVAGLCIGHLGRLAREPSADELAAIGRLDVVMVPVDPELAPPVQVIDMLQKLRTSLILLMRYGPPGDDDAFLDAMAGAYPIERQSAPSVALSLRMLPAVPTVLLLPAEQALAEAVAGAEGGADQAPDRAAGGVGDGG